MDNVADIGAHTAQIQNDFLYVFGRKGSDWYQTCLWRFDIRNRILLREILMR